MDITNLMSGELHQIAENLTQKKGRKRMFKKLQAKKGKNHDKSMGYFLGAKKRRYLFGSHIQEIK